MVDGVAMTHSRSALLSLVVTLGVAHGIGGCGAPSTDDLGLTRATVTGDPAPSAHVRIVAGNLSTGNNQSYDPGEGIRLLQALKPDIALLQELNYGANDDAAVRSFVTTTFGAEFSYFRETNAQIPNAVVSRFPIVQSGVWSDGQVGNRGFAWARVQVPGSHDIWAVSVHLLTSSSTHREAEASQLVGYLQAKVPSGDYIVVGGDFNTASRNEQAVVDFSGLLNTAGPYPDDQNGNQNTSQSRTHPHDWVLTSAALSAFEVPTVIGSVSRPHGLVFDTRVFAPLSDAPPALASDSAASNMQHMPVVRDFQL
jgi:endonuclease/exonuclease/phosphatase family metal-dependent hydrolase